MLHKIISWRDPLKLAKTLSIDKNYQENWLLLYSGLNKSIPNSKSYLAFYPKKELKLDNFNKLEEEINHLNDKFFGYLSYNLKNDLEDLNNEKDFKIKLPNLWLISFHAILEFNHDKKSIEFYYSNESFLKKIPEISKISDLEAPNLTKISSNFSKKEYLQKVIKIKEKITDGDLYQANLTRKFFGKIKIKNKFDIFLRLNKVSPANYSSFLKLEDNYIISSSPELFLEISGNGLVKSSPIKGTSARFKNKEQDQLSKLNLINSIKEQAENLMIVDLVRNDLSRSCEVNSVKVQKLFNISSYKTLHHMSSDVFGKKQKSISNLNIIKNCFPPASMTGTPKIAAMELCSNLEKLKRGVYSGAIGYLSKSDCELSVVIRTLIIQENNFEFQVGGAITYESDPLLEWQETINKAKGICKATSLNLRFLKAI